MPKIVVRGETAYECDECGRRIRVPANRPGLDILQRCIITASCKGALRQLSQANEINSTPAFPPEVPGVQDWFQRRVFYSHTQTLDAEVWQIEHNLANKPIIHAFVNTIVDGVVTLVATDEFTARSVDLNLTEVTFTRPTSGVVQAISLSSQNVSNPQRIELGADATMFQITSNTGELTIAVRQTGLDGWNDTDVDITLDFQSNPPVTITYPNIDNTPSLASPWVGANKIVANGKLYTVHSFNITDTNPAPTYFANGQMLNGTTFRVTKINNTEIVQGDVLILLGQTPYAAVDRITNKFVDAGRADSTLAYDSGKAYISTAFVKNTYPPITVV